MEKIEKAKYEGYVWWSDKDRPEVYYGNEEVNFCLNDGENPFIIEGNLWDENTLTSFMIRYVDGRYIVKKHEVDAEDLKEGSQLHTKKKYIAHRIDGVQALKFLQYWRPYEDKLCEKMSALRPEKLVFIGFDNKDKEEK